MPLFRNGIEVSRYHDRFPKQDGYYIDTDHITGESVETYYLVRGQYHGPRYNARTYGRVFSNYKHGKLHGLQLHYIHDEVTTSFYIDDNPISITKTTNDATEWTLCESDSYNKYQTYRYELTDGSTRSVEVHIDGVWVFGHYIRNDGLSGLSRYETDTETSDIRLDQTCSYDRVVYNRDSVHLTFDRYGFRS